MHTQRFDVVVVGSGPAGQKAALTAAKAGRRVLVVEREREVGGACVHRGTIPSKTLRETALALASLEKKTGGVVHARLPEDVQLESLSARLGQVIDAHVRSNQGQLDRAGIARWHGRASFLEPKRVAVTDACGAVREAMGDVVVIATGSRPRTPENVAIDHEHLLDSDSILAMRWLPRSLTVLGSGVIACEYASIFAALGVKVTIVDRSARPLAMCDPEITASFLASFEAAGGAFVGDAVLEEATFDGLCATVTRLRDGRVIASEKLLCALGRVANVEGLHLDRAGVPVNARGLVEVDAHGRSNVLGVYAVGDVIGPPSLASTSAEQGRRAIAHALGLPVGRPPELCPIGIYTIPEIASVGLDEGEAARRYGSAVVGRARLSDLARGQIAATTDGLLKMVADPEGRRLVGVQIVGEGAAELVHVGQLALLAGMDVDVFVDNVFNFPTLAEAFQAAALEIVERRNAARRTSLRAPRPSFLPVAS